MSRLRSSRAGDPAGQVWALLSLGTVIFGVLFDAIRWLMRRRKQSLYRRMLLEIAQVRNVELDADKLDRAAQWLADGGKVREPILSKGLLSSTIGDYFALIVWLGLKLVLLALAAIVAILGLRIVQSWYRIAELERLLK